MKLFLISQEKNVGWDTYDAAVVAAPDVATARQMSPTPEASRLDAWCDSIHVKVEHIGETEREQGVILSSFNAG